MPVMFVRHTSVSSGPNWKLKCRVPPSPTQTSECRGSRTNLALTEVNKVKDSSV